jgi:hypothetical protein
MADLFPEAPSFPPALPGDELRLLASLPAYDTVQEISVEDEAACRRLERRGLVKVHRWKDDPIAIRPTLYAGRLYDGPVPTSTEAGDG